MCHCWIRSNQSDNHLCTSVLSEGTLTVSHLWGDSSFVLDSLVFQWCSFCCLVSQWLLQLTFSWWWFNLLSLICVVLWLLYTLGNIFSYFLSGHLRISLGFSPPNILKQKSFSVKDTDVASNSSAFKCLLLRFGLQREESWHRTRVQGHVILWGASEGLFFTLNLWTDSASGCWQSLHWVSDCFWASP